MITRIKASLRYRIGKLLRPIRNRLDRKRYCRLQKGEDDFSIISQNCIGTFMYHDLGLKFCSPTINLFMEADDYIRFVERLEHYLSIDARQIVFHKSSGGVSRWCT